MRDGAGVRSSVGINYLIRCGWRAGCRVHLVKGILGFPEGCRRELWLYVGTAKGDPIGSRSGVLCAGGPVVDCQVVPAEDQEREMASLAVCKWGNPSDTHRSGGRVWATECPHR